MHKHFDGIFLSRDRNTASQSKILSKPIYIDYLICNSIDNNSIKMDNDKNWKVEKCDIFMSIPRNIRHWR